MRYVRGFCFSDSLEEETGFVWDGSHLLQEVHLDGRYTYIYANTATNLCTGTQPDQHGNKYSLKNTHKKDKLCI